MATESEEDSGSEIFLFLLARRRSGSIPSKVGGNQTRTTNNTPKTSKKAPVDNI
ncbi:hypothetical protein QUA70_08200 [Microcoleus sp. LAD1_D5]|uniref:hypothetical protein n=1 Tax=unclassified Microcoleus TaxID=2642155 RepID=UPI002FD65246